MTELKTTLNYPKNGSQCLGIKESTMVSIFSLNEILLVREFDFASDAEFKLIKSLARAVFPKHL
jgi:hypothetical protein